MNLSLFITVHSRRLHIVFDVWQIERIPAEPDIGVREDIENYIVGEIFVMSARRGERVPSPKLDDVITNRISRDGEYGDEVAEKILELL